jgi:hypothetical protein
MMWAIKCKGLGYVNINDDYSHTFTGVKLFRFKKEALTDIKMNGMNADEKVESPVKIEIKEIK